MTDQYHKIVNVFGFKIETPHVSLSFQFKSEKQKANRLIFIKKSLMSLNSRKSFFFIFYKYSMDIQNIYD